MWVNSEGTRIKDTIERVNKIKLSSFAEEIFINTMFTISKLPTQNMTNEEFINYKLDWLINNNKSELIANFLKLFVLLKTIKKMKLNLFLICLESKNCPMIFLIIKLTIS